MKLFPIFIIFLVPAFCTAADHEFYRLPKGNEPTFLIPPSVNGNLDYELVLNEKLLSRYGRGSLGTMLVLPAFTPEYCVSIYQQFKAPKSSLEVQAAGPHEFIASAAKASHNLHMWMQQKERSNQVSEIKVTYKFRKISRELAVAFQRVWARSILMTRYPRTVQPMIFDGITYRFSVVLEIGEISGEASNPQKGLGQDMAAIGYRLYEFVMNESATSKVKEADLIQALHTLEKRLN